MTILGSVLSRAARALALLSLTLLVSACSVAPKEDPRALAMINDFIEAVEQNQAVTAHGLLTSDARLKVSRSELAHTDGDFEHVVRQFRRAGIATRSKSPRREISYFVSNFEGQKGIVTFVISKESGAWKIANVLKDKDAELRPAW